MGAVVLGENGLYIGANIENASYGLSLCAERLAIAKAISEGEKKIIAIAVACIDAQSRDDIQELLPCGACRQWIAEFAPDSDIIILGFDKILNLNDLMPLPFRLR